MKIKVVLCWNILSVSGFEMKVSYSFEVFPTGYVLLKSVIREFAGRFDYFYSTSAVFRFSSFLLQFLIQILRCCSFHWNTFITQSCSPQTSLDVLKVEQTVLYFPPFPKNGCKLWPIVIKNYRIVIDMMCIWIYRKNPWVRTCIF